jgi:hypothetical protein
VHRLCCFVPDPVAQRTQAAAKVAFGTTLGNALEYGEDVTRRRWIDVLRAAALVAMCVAAAASASSSNKQQEQPPPYGTAPQGQAMEPSRAFGLWKSSFGAVKIEEDSSKGAGAGYIHGVWVYQRNGQDVVGYFGGNLSGNVLQFAWEEPAVPANLVGQGYLVFDPSGQRFNGRWWTTARDRTGEWSGWRQDAAPTAPPTNNGYDPYGSSTNPYGGGYGNGGYDPYGGNAYGGSTYGYGYPPPPPN